MPSEQGEAMTDEELKQAIEELNDTKAEQLTDEEFAALAEVYGKKETEQDIATLEKNIALMRDEELRVCVKEFFEKYLNHAEESDSGKMFHPITVSCCRVMMMKPLSNLLHKMCKLSGAKPREIYD
jgi:glutamyl-tRNA reductase